MRETVSQTLASLLLHMPRRSVLHVHNILLEMIRQDFPITVKPTNGHFKGRQTEKGHVWEIRHAGLLGIKYEVAVRSDLVTTASIPSEDPVKAEDVEMQDAQNDGGREVLRDVVDAAVLGYVRSV